MDNIYGINFNKGGKVYYFKSSLTLEENDKVIVSTEKGEQYGNIVSIVTDNKNKYKDLKEVTRVADAKDEAKYFSNLKDADRALKKCKELAEELSLKMNFISASYTFSKNQLLFNFYADDRVDFRELAKKLASIYKTRIELRQVGARDKAREVCGIGVCGQKLCCTKFLRQMESVTINMAKNQNLALNPNKINGACNRLLCCLAYEDEVYSEHRKKLPKMGEKVKSPAGYGPVVALNILNSSYTLNIDGERVEIKIDENKEK